MRVTLLSYTPSPVRQVAAAAKLCYSPSAIDTLYDNMTDDVASDFVSMLSTLGHESPIEHANYTFGIEDVSRSLLAQITRHRIASYSVQSQRYVDVKRFGYVTPPSIAAHPQASAIYEDVMQYLQEAYAKLSTLLEEQNQDASSVGGRDAAARKSALEDARFVLPNACHTNLICTMNARSLKNFFSQRCCNRAQWEIRALAKKMLLLVKDVSPALFHRAGPSCIRGNCPEGKMSCGNEKAVRDEFLAK